MTWIYFNIINSNRCSPSRQIKGIINLLGGWAYNAVALKPGVDVHNVPVSYLLDVDIVAFRQRLLNCLQGIV